MTPKQASSLTDHSHWFRYWMPYTFQQVGDRYLPLNRDYKPLGMITREHVRYEDYIESHGVKFARDPRTYTDVWHSPNAPLFLYADHPQTRLDYFERLARLMTRTVKVDPKRVKAMGRHV